MTVAYCIAVADTALPAWHAALLTMMPQLRCIAGVA